MPSLAQVRTRVDDWLEARWPTVQERQTSYAANHGGRYWQGLRCLSTEPLHTTASFADATPDLMASHPTDQAETWTDFLPEIAGLAIPAVVVFDVYQNATGWGYVCTVLAKHNGTIYRRSQNVGSETWRTVAWHIYTPGIN
jgi:hypothetical protein